VWGQDLEVSIEGVFDTVLRVFELRLGSDPIQFNPFWGVAVFVSLPERSKGVETAVIRFEYFTGVVIDTQIIIRRRGRSRRASA